MSLYKYNHSACMVWGVFISFALLLFAKCLIFHWNVYHAFLISSIVSNPLIFWSFWLPKIGVTLCIASLVFWSKRNWWTIVVALLIDTWMLANMFYLRSNGILFNGYTLTMASNMDGFWSSIWVLFEWKDFVPYLLTLAYSFFLLILNRKVEERYIKTGACWLLCTVLVYWYSFGLNYRLSVRYVRGEEVENMHSTLYYMGINPFSYDYRRQIELMNKDYAFYNFSVIQAFVDIMLDTGHNVHEMRKPYQIENRTQLADRLQMGENKELAYDNLLVLIIVESLESWTISDSIMPNLSRFMRSHPVLYAKYLKSQIVGGSSADGQMIINTGLLPIQQGATCFRYPWIKFPSVVNKKDSAVTILTHHSGAWNQDVMSEAYGYDVTLAGSVEDSILSRRVIEYAQRGYKTIQAITVASHIPFEHAHRSRLQLSENMPAQMKNYLKCLNWTDEGLGYLLDRIDSVSELKHATIVITGDHTIFWPDRRDEFEKYCISVNLDYDVQKGFVPLIIYSPSNITEDIEVDDICYQMDIYPTILQLLDTSNYYWRGFGVNLKDSVERQNRHWQEKEAYVVSDELIRSNWFETYDD